MEQIERARSRYDASGAGVGGAREAAALEQSSLVGGVQGEPARRDLLNSDSEIEARHRFLAASAGNSLETQAIFERIIEGNDLQPVSYLERGMVAARAIARINIRESPGRQVGWGSGFLIALDGGGGVLLTNHHVFPNADAARHSLAQFNVESGLDDTLKIYQEFALEPSKLFYANEKMDFAVVAVSPRSRTSNSPLTRYGCLPLLDVPGKASVGEWLTIIQHPGGQPKQVCVRENRLIKRDTDVLWYSTDTLGGSSGSPVFNNDWYVVALHHSGVPQTKGNKIQTIDGKDFDDATMGEHDIKWIANEGIRASRIVQTLKASPVKDHPMMKVMFAATPASARVGAGRIAETTGSEQSHTPAIAGTGGSTMSSDGNATVPLQVTIQLSRADLVRALGNSGGSAESASVEADEASRGSSKPRAAAFDAPFDADYSTRNGYDADFLGKSKHRVNLPNLSEALAEAAAPLIAKSKEHVLKYHNSSLVMHAERRLAMYSASNVNFGDRYHMSRPADVWRTDPRISAKHQLGGFYYASNQFDRGHLTRREDMEYGKTPVIALQSAADTCHWTNCTPQHSKFNQNKQVWQGIELYVLESAIIQGQFKAQIITGPVLSEGDPVYKNIQYPVRYWKVVAAVNGAGALFATAYIASQQEAIDEFGIEAAPLEPFGAYRNFQVKIAEVERLTGLSFTSDKDTPLSRADPLAKAGAGTGRRRRVRTRESASVDGTSSGYVELLSVEDIVL
jgi:endonuclease G